MTESIQHQLDVVSEGNDLTPIRGRRIAIVGYGNQGRGQAQTLRDSGCNVVVGSRPESATWTLAADEGFPVRTVRDAVASADVISILLPDQYQGQVFRESIAPVLAPGQLLLFAHGFSIHYCQIEPPPGGDVAMVAPVGPGAILRRLYLEGSGVPALLAVWQDATGNAWQIAHSYAAALGCTRIGVHRTTFAEETETDLFGEQAVLCGGLPALAAAGFDTLVDAGYQPEIAYFECIHQLKLIVDLIYERGIDGMQSAISDTALYGGYLAGPGVVDEHVRATLKEVLHAIQDGLFARRWIAESKAGMPALRRFTDARGDSLLERTGRVIRASISDPPSGSH